MASLAQEGDEGGLEVGDAGAVPGGRGVEVGGRAVEQCLAVGEHEQTAAVALGLGDVVGS